MLIKLILHVRQLSPVKATFAAFIYTFIKFTSFMINLSLILIFDKMDFVGTKRLELCRKALMFLHVQRVDRVFVDAEGRNLHRVTPPTRADTDIRASKLERKGLASDLVRAEEECVLPHALIY